ncbi:ScyD/ScyE family protein [Nocardioides sp. HM23]|uniref:ScyD/ScyE family protein n=1 Tax=Nocardioides bizhenqiangii TaxID=3095076 RepID=UPI002ACA5AF1|nr:ScyD/ScyE family protein [Nocardioides sp. HM23]MDZ5621550.1 ScyD/ScyE family protein [Nocardioides sp. HM23]
MSSSKSARRLVAAGVAALAALATTVAPNATASTSAPSDRDVLAHGLLSPLSVAVTNQGAIVYSANFAGELYLKKAGEPRKLLFRSKKGAEVGAVSVDRRGVWFVHGAALMRRTWKGEVRRVAGLGAHEQATNPDGEATYGAPSLSPECAAQWPTGPEAPPQEYDGIVESHPYGTATAGGPVYVADAAGNSILKVRRDGTVSTLAVLPAIPVEITQEFADSADLPDCAVGHSYRFEPVPTDVEIGPDGLLYVSSLPGGPEDGTVPGGVFTVDPANGNHTQIATDLVSATGLDVAANGDVFVSELFAGKITRIAAGGGAQSTFVRVPFPAAVELEGDFVYASVNVLSGLSGQPGDAPAGKVVRYTP